MDDKEFLGLDLEGAKEYMLAYATSVKQYEKDIALARSEAELWRGRVGLAESKGAAELAAGARAKAAEAEGRTAALEAERAGLAADLARLRERLPYLKARERSVDPDRLLAELQLMTGELLDGEVPAATPGAGAAGASDGTLAESQPGAEGAGAAQAGASGTTGAQRSEASLDRDLGKLEKAARAETALEELKRRMGGSA